MAESQRPSPSQASAVRPPAGAALRLARKKLRSTTTLGVPASSSTVYSTYQRVLARECEEWGRKRKRGWLLPTTDRAFELVHRLPPPAPPSHRDRAVVVVVVLILILHVDGRWPLSLCPSSPLVFSASSERVKRAHASVRPHRGQVTSESCAGASGRLCSCPSACGRGQG
eukprot:scaffold9631_cov35-Tisochrysis_lutea.AAC.1